MRPQAHVGREFGMHQKSKRTQEGKPPWGWSQSRGAARRPPNLELGVNGGGSIPVSVAQPGHCDGPELARGTGTHSRLKEEALAGFGFYFPRDEGRSLSRGVRGDAQTPGLRQVPRGCSAQHQHQPLTRVWAPSAGNGDSRAHHLLSLSPPSSVLVPATLCPCPRCRS